MSKLFICHSSEDDEASARLRAGLTSLGHHSVFLDFDPDSGIPAGFNWERQLYSKLRLCQAVIVVCSRASMSSRWCFHEIAYSRSLGKPVIPFRIDDGDLDSILQDVQHIDAQTDWNEAILALGRGLRLAGVEPENPGEWSGTRAPYPGLLAFDEEDEPIFFGRSDEISQGLELLNRVHQYEESRPVLIVGSSGSGKSSLLKAGLLPRLRRDPRKRLLVGPFRPGAQPFEALLRALKPHLEPEVNLAELHKELTAESRLDGLVRVLRNLRLARDMESVLLVIDQVEEALDNPTGDQFMALLRELLDSSGGVSLLGTLRSDFLGFFQQHRIKSSTLLLYPMECEALAEVIKRPAVLAEIEFDSKLTEALMNDTASGKALPLLAFTLRELYEKYGKNSGRLTVENYHVGLGGLQGSVRRSAEEVLKRCRERLEHDDWQSELALLRRAFLVLVRPNLEGQFVRRKAFWSDLPARAHEALECFVQARLLVSSANEDGRTIEVAHEALFSAWDRLHTWLEEEREALHLRARLESDVSEWLFHGKDINLLFREPFLVRAEKLLKEHPIRPLEREYLESSRAHLEDQRQKAKLQKDQLATANRNLVRSRQSLSALVRCKLEFVRGDIVEQEVDAIVTAANSSLTGGGGVDGAIHRAGGPDILEECLKIGGCRPGDAVVTGGGRLHARIVVHAVGPRWRGGDSGEARVLRSAYTQSLLQAVAHQARSIAFPSISTGTYGYPVDQAAFVAIEAVMDFLAEDTELELVRFVLFSYEDLRVYLAARDRVLTSRVSSLSLDTTEASSSLGDPPL